jgi:cell division protein FtsL
MRTTNEVLIKQYLLGEMPKEERSRFEDQYLTDAEMFEELVNTENELVDSFARGSLSEFEKRQFEQNYCVSRERRDKVEFAKALAQVVQHELRTSAPNKFSLLESFLAFFRVLDAKLQWALVVVAALLIAGVVGLALQDYGLRGELHQARTDQEQLRKEEDGLRKQIAEFKNHNQPIPESEQGNQVARLGPPPDLTFNLTPGTERSSTVLQKDFVIPPSPWIRLEMPLYRDEYRNYEAVLLNAELQEVLRGKDLKSRPVRAGTAVIWRLPSNSFKSADYVVQLNGKEEGGRTARVQSYSFRTTRK